MDLGGGINNNHLFLQVRWRDGDGIEWVEQQLRKNCLAFASLCFGIIKLLDSGRKKNRRIDTQG